MGSVMSNITITLTQDQLDALYFVVNEDINSNITDKHYTAFMGRIRTKLAKAKS